MKYFLAFLCFLIAGFTLHTVYAQNCVFDGSDIKNSFKGCNPSLGINPTADGNYDIQESGSDFRTFVATTTRRIQIFTSIIAIGVIVWIGFLLVFPANAEEKESYKSKLISVMLGFFAMIAATLLVNGLINLIYEILK